MTDFYIKKFKDIPKFTLWAESPVEGRRARLVLAFRDGNPRITVYTGVSGKEGIISFPCDIPNFAGILNLLKDLTVKENGEKYTIDSLTVRYENDKPTKEKKLVSTLHIGKSKEGMIYLAVISETHPKIIFPIKPSEYHIFKDKDGNVINDSVMSVRMTAMLCDVMLNGISDVMIRHAEEEVYTKDNTPKDSGGIVKNISINKTYDVDEDLSF